MKVVLLIVLFCSSAVFADTKSEITALMAQQDAAWNRGDLDTFVGAYDDTKELVFVSTVVIRSREELKARYEKRYKTGNADFGKLTSSELEVEELAPGLARAWGKWTVVQKDQTLSGWFSLILRKKESGWKIIHDHSS